MDNLMEKIIGISIAMVMVAALVPMSLESFFSVDTENWSSIARTLWALIPVFAVIAIALMFVGYVKYKRGQ